MSVSNRHFRSPPTVQTAPQSGTVSAPEPELSPIQNPPHAFANLPNPPVTPEEARPAMNLMSLSGYQYGKILGEGAFSTVLLVRERTTGQCFAMKMCNRAEAMKKKIVDRLRREKNILSKLRHPLIPELIACFITGEDVVFVLSLAIRGDMAPFLRRLGSFDMNCTKFYIAEVVLALQYLHSQSILHRDLKPVNILLKHDYHILLTDFGTAKDLNEGRDDQRNTVEHDENESGERGRKSSFVGSPQFVSPEVLQNKPVTEACDYFALGSIIFQFLAGEAPFSDETEYLMFYKVLNLDYSFPEAFPPVAKDLVEKFLVLDPELRLGHPRMGGCEAVKQHMFFNEIDFDSLLTQRPPILRPFLPAVSASEEELYSDSNLNQISESQEEVDEQGSHWHDRPIDVFKGFDDSMEDSFAHSSTPTSNRNYNNTSSAEIANPVPVSIDSGQLASANLRLQQQGVGNISVEQYRAMLKSQKEGTPWDVFAKDRLIIKMGLLDKRVGYFSRRRMFLFLQGPIFLYIDPRNKEHKGEIKWCDSLTPELKNDKIFFIHVPGRVYYLICPDSNAKEWVDTINRVKQEINNATEQLKTTLSNR